MPVLRRGCGELTVIQGTCPALRTLDAQFCHSLGQPALQHLAACAPGLTSLLLPYCSAVSCAALGALGGLAQLHTLDLSFTALQVLVASWCSAIVTSYSMLGGAVTCVSPCCAAC